MKYEPIQRPAYQNRDSLFSDLGLIGQAIIEAFRGMSSASRLESRWARERWCNANCTN